ncbi:PAS domain-containing protein [Paraburkholderia sp. BL10I2N1]|uniref:PAS domain-containing protein n=1 Tax=Paraburkholderia sp. BL10I2N1 TaxID=1938796 RepID=UPI00105EEAB7|nr:PAS domain-containing protein [Paraburkholderia sp. BL10I2N1]
MALIASFSEVASAAFHTRFFIPTLNSVTAALVSSLMAALAIGEQIRAERAERLRAQAELRRAYDVTPVGLVTVAADGEFVQFNPALEAMLGMERGAKRLHWDDYFPAASWQPIYRQATDTGAVEIELSRDGGIRLASDAASTTQTASGRLATYGDIVAPPRQGGTNVRHYLLKAAHDGTRLECSRKSSFEERCKDVSSERL